MANFFVSISGSDANPGTLAKPFRTIAKGLSVLAAGDVLNLRAGNYVEPVEVKGKNGSQTSPIVIRSHAGEQATLDGSVLQFRQADNDEWEPASLQDPNAHPDEYISRDAFALDSSRDRVNRGAFLDREPYTRLITYSRLEDLRAENQTFDKLPLDDPRPGPEVTDKAGNGTGFKRPWVYMGPGLFFNRATGRVHIRLSHTSNNVSGLADYEGEVDPRKLRLAISHKERTTLVVQNSSFVRFEKLSIRFGGENTLEIRKTKNIVFDHVRLLAASHGVRLGGSTGTVFRHCEIRGGLPGWYFRSDRKAEYRFKDGGTVTRNLLGKQTSRVLFSGGKENTGIEIHNCEFLDAHDFYLFGQDIRFHHNWVHNLNDEALFIDAVETDNLRIFQNVVTKCLSAVSFAGRKIGGRTYVYRNLIDLRQPTGGFRPRRPGDKNVFRFGQLYKSNGVDGPLDLFQNTCLESRQGGQASYLHYRNTGGPHPRRSFNNVFIAVNPDSGSDRAITFIPSPSFPGPTDGNCYFRIGSAEKPLLRFLNYKFQGGIFRGGTFKTLELLRAPSNLFNQSKTQYPPGYEATSIEADPRFRQRGVDGAPQLNDDLRLRSDSPARGKGIVLLPDLRDLDPLAPSQGSPDIGCYAFGKPGLRVGVDGRRHFPSSPGGISP
ncbi:MAG TPA: right-handed parallel beta-helix repeat-containing protein [Thermoanaerobaculia bacterium]